MGSISDLVLQKLWTRASGAYHRCAAGDKLYPSLRSILSEQSFPDYFTHDAAWQQYMYKNYRHRWLRSWHHKSICRGFRCSGQFVVSGSPLPSRRRLATVSRRNAAYYVAFTSTLALTTNRHRRKGLPLGIIHV
jgi:hypothetical protein